MRSRFVWLLAGAAVAAAIVARFLRRSRSEPAPQLEADPRADQLRRRIAEARDVVDERDAFEEAETPVDEADPDVRRRDVHQRGRAALERMRGEPEG
jgi:hypothetical protein